MVQAVLSQEGSSAAQQGSLQLGCQGVVRQHICTANGLQGKGKHNLLLLQHAYAKLAGQPACALLVQQCKSFSNLPLSWSSAM